MGPKLTVATLGYESRDLAGFMDELRRAGVGVVVDVRQHPVSRKKGFSRRPLAAALEQVGIRYVHAAFAGNPREIRSAAGSAREAAARYRDHLLAHPDILDQLDTLLAVLAAEGLRPCLVCFERDPTECHRLVLVEQWRAMKRPHAPVLHLGVEAPPG